MNPFSLKRSFSTKAYDQYSTVKYHRSFGVNILKYTFVCTVIPNQVLCGEGMFMQLFGSYIKKSVANYEIRSRFD